MTRPTTTRPTRASTLRAVAVAVTSLVATALIWRWRPAASIPTTSPDAGIVAGCTWLAWALAGYLAVAVAATAVAHIGSAGSLAMTSIQHIAPARLRRLVDAAISVGVAGAIVGTTAAAPAAAISVNHVAVRPPTVAGSPFDWPGLSNPQSPRHSPHHHHGVRHHSQQRTVSSGSVVVAPGDTLWAIAAHHLGPRASAAAVTTAWHAWYAANRSIIGSDPGLIQPGQRLVTPDVAGIVN
jgi:nucleoid-associated protein YgaU